MPSILTHHEEIENLLLRNQKKSLELILRAGLWRMRFGWISRPQDQTRNLGL